MNLKINEIKNLFQSGALKDCSIVENKDMFESGYVLWFTTSNGGQISIRTQRRALQIKTYKSIQSAINVARDIGFRDIILSLNSTVTPSEIKKELSNEIFD